MAQSSYCSGIENVYGQPEDSIFLGAGRLDEKWLPRHLVEVWRQHTAYQQEMSLESY